MRIATATASAAAAAAPAPSTAEDAAENLTPNVVRPSHRIIGIIHHVHVARRVVLHGIDQRVELLRVHHVALETGGTTGRIDTVSEKHDGLSSLNATQLLVDDHVDRIVQARAVAGPGTLNRVVELAAIGGEFTQNLDFVIEGNDHHAVV